MKWILILFAHVGPLGSGNSNAIATADFQTRALCEAAGKQAKKLAGGSTKVIEFTCVRKEGGGE